MYSYGILFETNAIVILRIHSFLIGSFLFRVRNRSKKYLKRISKKLVKCKTFFSVDFKDTPDESRDNLNRLNVASTVRVY